MYLQHLHVRHFRNLEDIEVTFQPGLNVLVGPNDIGKSNLLLALQHALGPAATQGYGALWPTEDDLHRNPSGVITSETIEVTLTYADLGEQNRSKFLEMLDLGLEGDLSVVRLRYEAVWNDKKGRFSVHRWGGPEGGDRAPVPGDLIQDLPLTFLPALRDAEEALSPGARSRLARLLRDYERDERELDHATGITDIFRQANAALNAHDLVTTITEKLEKVTKGITGTDYSAAAIKAADPEFARILRALRIVLPGNPVAEISSSGLGYNNLLYMAVVIAHLRESPQDEAPILVIEEPEAHLHPQLTVQLGTYLSGNLIGTRPPQTIVTTHSPTLSSKVKPSQVAVLHRRQTNTGGNRIVCNSLSKLELLPEEERQLQRLIDITRATLYFAKGLILVEGICEELLLPNLAHLVGYNLVSSQVSVLPLCGVSFGAIRSILNHDGLGIPTAIVTDGDPPIDGDEWRSVEPQRKDDGEFKISPRVQKLIRDCKGHSTIRVFHSEVTLEYDLAAAGPGNPLTMTELWEEYHPQGRTLTRTMLDSSAPSDRALCVWRGICMASHSKSKAGYAHVLAERLEPNSMASNAVDFAVPAYLENAFDWVCTAKSEIS